MKWKHDKEYEDGTKRENGDGSVSEKAKLPREGRGKGNTERKKEKGEIWMQTTDQFKG